MNSAPHARSDDHPATVPGRYRHAVQRVLLITLGLNLAVVLIKLGVGLLSGSMAVVADAVHSVTDCANNVLALLVLRLASAPPDREHPYGHQKYEALGALVIAALLAVACYEILRAAGLRLWAGEFAAPQLQALDWALMIGVLGVNIGVASYERRAGARLGSSLLLADAKHTLSDIWVTLSVLLSLLGSTLLGWGWLDVALALPVAAIILHSGWQVLQRNLPWLLDARALPAEEIAAVALSVAGVAGCHDITSRGMHGQQLYIELHVTTELSQMRDAHRVAEQVRKALEARYRPARVTVHIEPEAPRGAG